MRIFFLLTFFASLLFGAKAVESRWLEGQKFSSYLIEHNASIGLIRNMDEDDRKLLSEIEDGVRYQELYDADGTLLQALIPIGEEMQIQLIKGDKSDTYLFDIIPINYFYREHNIVLKIETNIHQEILEATNNLGLTYELEHMVRYALGNRKINKNDTLAFIYTQKERLGKPFGAPQIKIAMVESEGKRKFIYVDAHGTPYTEIYKTATYDTNGNEITDEQLRQIEQQNRFGMPIRHVRITSGFTYKRWHPILHRYRPHFGVDFAAKKGTPLMAVNDGTVTFAGVEGGYGNVIKIKHQDDYVSLYAHLSSMRVSNGDHIRKGEIIGYAGSTGRSTGPHLHFGLYSRGKAIDPLAVLERESGIIEKFFMRKIAIKGAEQNRAKILAMLHTHTRNYRWEKIETNSIPLNDNFKSK